MISKSHCINDVSVKNSYKYSICTIVSDKNEYGDMLRSFTEAGFDGNDIEFIHIDNSSKNNFDAYESVRKFLNIAGGEYVIICHQDILIKDTRNQLNALLEELEILDPNWAMAGNAGGVKFKKFARYFMNHHEKMDIANNLPCRVYSLDENFLILKRAVRITPSINMDGFHFYGTDMCLQADMCGYSAYVIKFLLHHKSHGNTDKHFYAAKEKLRLIYKKQLRTRAIQTTCTRMILSGSALFSGFLSSKFVVLLVKEYYKRIRNN